MKKKIIFLIVVLMFISTNALSQNIIHGRITGDVQAGITVNVYVITCGAPQPYAELTTDAQGYYAIGDIANGRYLVLPEASDYSFDPVADWVDIPQAVIQPSDFTATSNTCVPGEIQACYCSDGTETEQACETDGTGWETCDCAEYTIWNDPDTDLSWQDPQKDAYVPDYSALTQPDALRYCDELVMGGYDNWRLPNIDELRTLVRGNPSSEADGDCPVHEGSPKADMEDPACVQAPDYEGPGTDGCYRVAELTGPCDRKDPADEGDRALETVSSTLASDDSFWVGDVLFDQGSVVFNHIFSLAEARCVREGPTAPNKCADGMKAKCLPGATRKCTAANGKPGAQVCADDGLCWMPCDSTSFVPSPPAEDVSEQCDQLQLTLKVPVKFESPPKMLLAFLYAAESWDFPPNRPPDGGTDYNQILDPDIDVGKPLEMNLPACSYYRDRCIPAGEYYLYVALLQSNEWPPWPGQPGDYSFGVNQVPLTLNSGGPRQVIELEPLLNPYEE